MMFSNYNSVRRQYLLGDVGTISLCVAQGSRHWGQGEGNAMSIYNLGCTESVSIVLRLKMLFIDFWGFTTILYLEFLLSCKQFKFEQLGNIKVSM